MDASCTASMIRRAVAVPASRWASRWLLFGLLVFGLAGQAAAQSCDFVPIGSQTALAPANSQVSFTFQAQTACAATVTGTISITTDGTGGASAGSSGCRPTRPPRPASANLLAGRCC